MPNEGRRPFVEPTLIEEGSLAEVTLVSARDGNNGGTGGGTVT